MKYIANRPAKNISSLDSHTIVPTLTMFGRVSECTLLESKLDAVAGRGHHRIMSCPRRVRRSGVSVVSRDRSRRRRNRARPRADTPIRCAA